MKCTTQNEKLEARCKYELCKICKVWKTIWKTIIQICNTANELQFAAMESVFPMLLKASDRKDEPPNAQRCCVVFFYGVDLTLDINWIL